MSAVPRVVAVLAALVVEAHGFRTMVSAGCGLALRSSGNPHGLLPLGLRKQRAPVLRMQTQDTEKDTVQTPMEEAGAERGSFMGTKNFVPDGGDWFEKTTTFADRENNDPLAPVRKELRAAKAPESKMVGVERESNNWYKNQEKKRSMFGRTLNPLTGELQDIDEAGSETLNPLEDPIFYVLLIVGTPVLVMFGAAQACLLPALSMSFGIECSF